MSVFETKICQNKDMLYTFIPKKVAKVLSDKGIGKGDKIVWRISVVDNNVVCILTFSKETK